MAQIDVFVKIEGVKGESTDPVHPEWIDVEKLSWGLESSGSALDPDVARTGKISVQDLTFEKRVDASTPKLVEALVTGEITPLVTIHFRDQPDEPPRGDKHVPYLEYKLTSALVTGYKINAEDLDEQKVRPAEFLSVNFSKIAFEYILYDSETGEEKERIPVEYDVKANKA